VRTKGGAIVSVRRSPGNVGEFGRDRAGSQTGDVNAFPECYRTSPMKPHEMVGGLVARVSRGGYGGKVGGLAIRMQGGGRRRRHHITFSAARTRSIDRKGDHRAQGNAGMLKKGRNYPHRKGSMVGGWAHKEVGRRCTSRKLKLTKPIQRQQPDPKPGTMEGRTRRDHPPPWEFCKTDRAAPTEASEWGIRK